MSVTDVDVCALAVDFHAIGEGRHRTALEAPAVAADGNEVEVEFRTGNAVRTARSPWRPADVSVLDVDGYASDLARCEP